MTPFSLHPATTAGLHYLVHGLPAPLAGAPFPTRLWPDWLELKRAGFRHIVCLASTTPENRYDPGVTGLTWLAKCDLQTSATYCEAAPLMPLESRAASANAMDEIVAIARKVLSALWAGEGVLIHCEFGIERTGLLVGVVLVLHGADPKEVTDRLGVVLDSDGLEGPNFSATHRALFWHVALFHRS
jgi:protein tyrosine/serine phosphatase